MDNEPRRSLEGNAQALRALHATRLRHARQRSGQSFGLQSVKPVVTNADYLVSPHQLPDVRESCEIHFTRFGRNLRPGGTVAFCSDARHTLFVNVNEPTTSAWTEKADHIVTHHYRYTHIITSNPTVLDNCPNALFLAYGTTWLNKSEHHRDSLGCFTEDLGRIPKDASVSMLCGSLKGKAGYSLRHAIWSRRRDIPARLKFYASTRSPILGEQLLPRDDKIHLFTSMYSVAVESSSETNYFTEKLIDCLITKTIPVYWGCPNISDFFDTSYWIHPDRIFSTEYTDTYYKDNLEKVDANFEKAKSYARPLLTRVLETAGLLAANE